MKLMCYAVLFIAFLIYYQSQPVFTIIIVVLMFGAYFLLKSRKGGKGSLLGTVLRSGKGVSTSNGSADLMNVLLIQMLGTSDSNGDVFGFEPFSFDESFSIDEREQEIDQQKQRILSLFEE